MKAWVFEDMAQGVVFFLVLIHLTFTVSAAPCPEGLTAMSHFRYNGTTISACPSGMILACEDLRSPNGTLEYVCENSTTSFLILPRRTEYNTAPQPYLYGGHNISEV